MDVILGIDIGKADFHAALLAGDNIRVKSFPNNAKGFAQLDTWLGNRDTAHVHACLEATGGYSETLALHLHEAGHMVSIVNPSRIKAFGQSELLRTKNDAVDAALIARFCRAHRPEPWIPPSPEIRALQTLVRRHAALQEMLQQETNRLEAPAQTSAIGRSLRDTIAYLKRELKRVEREIADHVDRHPTLRRDRDLLTTIPGLGDLTAARILGEMPKAAEFRGAKAVAAFAGLSPRERRSGSSVRGKTKLAKIGNAFLRKALFYPALVAIRWNPTLKAFTARLLAAGKPKMLVVGAVMRKLIILAYAILKTQRPYTPPLEVSA